MKLKATGLRAGLPALWLNVIMILLACETVFAENIIAFGDSLTQGCNPIPVTCGMRGGYGYPNELQLLLEADGLNLPVYNYGRRGETTDDGANRIDEVLDDVCNREAGYILILEGTNDLGFLSSFETIRFNLEVMIDKARARGLVPFLATITPDPRYEWKDIQGMNENIRMLAAEKEVVLVDLYARMEPDWRDYVYPYGCYGDKLHPNEYGFQVMAAEWYEYVMEHYRRNLPKSWMYLLLGQS
ncbi:MAG TPA: SGNH/GDSL hydrolase family protein [Desulfobacteraceae bacterium]|nr:SGNH/GDSL hydrolase family protein [Desulfobacteraceae bacterium]